MLRVYTSLTGGYGVLCDTLQDGVHESRIRQASLSQLLVAVL